MRHVFLLCSLALAGLTFTARAQGVGIGTPTPHPNAALEVKATDKGLLIPRMDSAQRVAITPAPDGLMVFQLDGRRGFWYAVGGTWYFIPDKTRAGDNLGTHTATQNLNLTDKLLVGGTAATPGTSGLLILPNGNVGIGTAAPAAALHVSAPPVYAGTYGPNRAPGTAITASSAYPGASFAAVNATDDLTTTLWSANSGQALPQWLRLDFGAAAPVVRQYELVLQGSLGSNDAAGAWTLQGSPDAGTWTALHTASSAVDGTFTYAVPNTVGYRYYRLLVTAARPGYTGSDVTVREWRVREEQLVSSEPALKVGPGPLALTSGAAVSSFSTDGTLAGNADDAVPTQRAVKTYVDAAAAPQTLSATTSGGTTTISLTNGGTATVPSSADNLGNHLATQAISWNTDTGDRLLFAASLGAFGSKISHGAGNTLTYYAGATNALGGTHRFLTGTATGFVERLRIGADGNVGIGTTAPTSTLDVAGVASAIHTDGAVLARALVATDYQAAEGPADNSDGKYHTAQCGSGYGITTGAVIANNGHLDGFLKVNCANLTYLLRTTGTWRNGPTNTADNQFHTTACTANEIATGVRFYATSYFDGGPDLFCQPVAAGVTRGAEFRSAWSVIGPPSNGVSTHFGCPPGTYLTQLSVYANTYLDRSINVFCATLNK